VGAFLLSFGVIFAAELGDKSQLMAMAFATRYRFWTVLAGITAATAVVHFVSVAVGSVLGTNLPTHVISVVAGVAFLRFGLWTLRGDELTDDEAVKAKRAARSAFLAVAVAFFLAELGDKTMLATVTLATTEAGSAPGLARPSAWSPPTPWPSPSGRCSGATCRRRSSKSVPPCCSSPSASCSSPRA